LLREIVPDFEVLVAPVDEEALTVPDPWETAEWLALAKARAVAALRPEALVIGGDTVVAYVPSPPTPSPGTNHPGEGAFVQLAKPRDEADAMRMLRALSGRDHVVITGVAFVSPQGERSLTDTTTVSFRELTDEEIAAYVATGEPMDKAGAYAIQGGAAAFVARIEGSWSNVVGLPVEAVNRVLDHWVIGLPQ
jgi:septum formation protein